MLWSLILTEASMTARVRDRKEAEGCAEHRSEAESGIARPEADESSEGARPKY
jgi:hypothetical protein